MTTLWLLRHAESVPDPLTPQADWPLSPRGHEQARALIPQLQDASITHIASSPYCRALDTVRPFARAVRRPIEVIEDLRERHVSHTLRDDFLEVMARSWSDLDFALPGCESSRACQARVRRAIDALVAAHPPDACLLISSHGNVIGLLLQQIEPSFGFEDWRALPNPHLLVVHHDGARMTRP